MLSRVQAAGAGGLFESHPAGRATTVADPARYTEGEGAAAHGITANALRRASTLSAVWPKVLRLLTCELRLARNIHEDGK